MRKITCLAIIFGLFLAENAFPWGSVETGGGAFATHQFLNNKAYDILKKKKAFAFSSFPSISDIQSHSGVSAPSKKGLGPDDADRSDYDWHWYNPSTRDGKTPDKVREYHSDLVKNMGEMGNKTPSEKQKEEAAHNAAYVSHFMQDMTCPFHVFGMSESRLSVEVIGTDADMGPFFGDILSDDFWLSEIKDKVPENEWRKYAWKTLVERHFSDQHPGTNFFDATYYDGTWPATTMTSSHFEYEAAVEVKYKFDVTAKAKFIYYESRYGEIPEFWQNGMDLRMLTHKVADRTRQRIGTKENPGELWVDISRLKRDTAVPYYDWWRAIQLTYALWRSSFSALHAEADDIRMSKVPNKEDAYKVKVRIWNWEEKEPALNVKVNYDVKGGSSGTGQGSVKGSIRALESSDWLDLAGDVIVKSPADPEGTIRITIKGQYNDSSIPDSGEKIVEYDLKDISFDAIKMDDVRMTNKDSAKEFLESYPRNFKVVFVPAGEPDIPDKHNLVESQNPAPGAWVAPGETVNLMVYDEYLVDVANVIGSERGDAIGTLSDLGLNPLPGEILVEYDEPEGIVIVQDPAEGRVRPGTDITILVAKKKPAPPEEAPVESADDPSVPGDDYELPLTPVTRSEALMDIQMSPQAVTIKLGESAAITAVPIDIEGNPVRGKDLARFSYEWMVNDPSIGNISGNGITATVSGIKPGAMQAIVKAGGSMGVAAILIEEGDPAEGLDGHSPEHSEPPSSEDNVDFSSDNSAWETEPAPSQGGDAGGESNLFSDFFDPNAAVPQERTSETDIRNEYTDQASAYQREQQLQQQNLQNQMNMMQAMSQIMNTMNNIRNMQGGTNSSGWKPPVVNNNTSHVNNPYSQQGSGYKPPVTGNTGGGATKPPSVTPSTPGVTVRPGVSTNPNAVVLLGEVAPEVKNPNLTPRGNRRGSSSGSFSLDFSK